MNQEHSPSPQPSQFPPSQSLLAQSPLAQDQSVQSRTLTPSKKRWALAGICSALLILSGFILSPANGTDVPKSMAIPKSGSSPSRPVSKIAAASPITEKAAADAAAAVPKPVSRKLPAGFNELDLTDEQKQEIADIREARQKKLDALEEAVREYKAETEREFESVLTNAQRKQLAQSRNADSMDSDSSKSTDSKKKKASSSKTKIDPEKPAKKATAKKTDS